MGKVGIVTAFAAEASLWLAGAVIVAGAAGTRWDMPAMPAIDLGGLIAPSSLDAGPSQSASASLAVESPSGSPAAATALARYLAYTGRPGFQYAVTFTGSSSYRTTKGTTRYSLTGSEAGAGKDCSESSTNSTNRTSHQIVLVGQNQYERVDNGPWQHEGRLPGDTCEAAGSFRYQSLVDKGLELKNGARLHRLEVADSAQFGSYYEGLEAEADSRTAFQDTLIIWVHDDGSPAAFRLSRSYDQILSSTLTTVTYTCDYVVTKLSGVAITAPKIPSPSPTH